MNILYPNHSIVSSYQEEYREVQKTGAIDPANSILHKTMKNFVEEKFPDRITNDTWVTPLQDVLAFIRDYNKHPLNEVWKNMLVQSIVDYNNSLQTINYDVLVIMRYIIVDFAYVPDAFLPAMINEYMVDCHVRRVSVILESSVRRLLSAQQNIQFKKACLECGDTNAMTKYIYSKNYTKGTDSKYRKYTLDDFYSDLPEEYKLGIFI